MNRDEISKEVEKLFRAAKSKYAGRDNEPHAFLGACERIQLKICDCVKNDTPLKVWKIRLTWLRIAASKLNCHTFKRYPSGAWMEKYLHWSAF